MKKNIVDKYLEEAEKFVIFISGLPGCGKLELGENIARDFKFKLLDTYNYYKDDYGEMVKLKNPENEEEVEVVNWYTESAVDWTRLNTDVDTNKKTGVVVVGMDLNKITTSPNYHIHLNISKQVSIEKTQKYIEQNKNKYPEEYELIGTPMEKYKMNKLIYPYYMETTKLAKINKYITVKEMNDDQVYDIAFDTLMKFVESYVYKNANKNSSVNKSVGKKQDNIEMELELLDVPRYTYDDDMDMMNKLNSDTSDAETSSDADTSSDTDTDIDTSNNTSNDSIGTSNDSIGTSNDSIGTSNDSTGTSNDSTGTSNDDNTSTE